MKRRRLHRRYGHAATPKFWHIGHGYRVTDVMAAELARQSGRKTPLSWMPQWYEMKITLPNGVEAWLARTNVSTSVYGFKAPSRGWVWYVHSQDPKFFDWIRTQGVVDTRSR